MNKDIRFEIFAAAQNMETARDLLTILARADRFAEMEAIAKEDGTSSVDLNDGSTSNYNVLKDLSYKSQDQADRLRELHERVVKNGSIPDGTIKKEIDACEVLISYGYILYDTYAKNELDDFANICQHLCDYVITEAIRNLREIIKPGTFKVDGIGPASENQPQIRTLTVMDFRSSPGPAEKKPRTVRINGIDWDERWLN